VPSDEAVGLQDTEALARQESEQLQRSAELATEYTTRLALTETLADLQRIGSELTPPVKRGLAPKDLERVRRAYAERQALLKPSLGNKNENGRVEDAATADAQTVSPESVTTRI
jgi:hypothetical protein